jgi:hypothetical protein
MLGMDEDVAEWRRTEAECLSRFREKALVLMANDPTLSELCAHTMAARSLPQTLERYFAATARLQNAGRMPRPWR